MKKEITSPNYPHTYNANQRCNWVIVVPSDNVIVLTFESFELEPHSSCGYDSLEAFDGSSSSSSSLGGKLCGGDLPPPLSSRGNMLHLQFISDAGVNQRGFKISYRLESKYYRNIEDVNTLLQSI